MQHILVHSRPFWNGSLVHVNRDCEHDPQRGGVSASAANISGERQLAATKHEFVQSTLVPAKILLRPKRDLFAVLVALLFGFQVSAGAAGESAELGELSLVSAAASFPECVDLRPVFAKWGLTARRQGERPTCSVFVVAGALEYASARRQGQGQGPRLSVEFLNWAANRMCGETNDGSFFSDLWRGYKSYGVCAEEAMPYQARLAPNHAPSADALADAKNRLALPMRLHWIKEWNVNTGLTDEHLVAIKNTLRNGWPVCGGFRWPKQAQWVDDVLQMCAADQVYDGHSVLIVGYRQDTTQPGGGVFIFLNTSGSRHEGYMPYAYAQAFMNDAAWVDYEAPRQSQTGWFRSREPQESSIAHLSGNHRAATRN